MKFRVTFKRQEPYGIVAEWVEHHESVVVTSSYLAKKWIKTHMSRNRFYAGCEVIKVELLEQRVKGTT